MPHGQTASLALPPAPAPAPAPRMNPAAAHPRVDAYVIPTPRVDPGAFTPQVSSVQKVEGFSCRSMYAVAKAAAVAHELEHLRREQRTALVADPDLDLPADDEVEVAVRDIALLEEHVSRFHADQLHAVENPLALDRILGRKEARVTLLHRRVVRVVILQVARERAALELQKEVRQHRGLQRRPLRAARAEHADGVDDGHQASRAGVDLDGRRHLHDLDARAVAAEVPLCCDRRILGRHHGGRAVGNARCHVVARHGGRRCAAVTRAPQSTDASVGRRAGAATWGRGRGAGWSKDGSSTST